MNRFILSALLAVLLLAGPGPASAQESQALLQAARAGAAEARASDETPNPDQALWREAIRLAELARREQPEDPETVLFQARLYSEVSWYSRAWGAWLDYFALTGVAPDDEAFATAAHQLGFSRYQAGSLSEALDYYQKLLEFQPANAEALSWIGRIHLEAGEPAAALPHLQQLQEQAPGDPAIAYQLARAEAMVSFGSEAASAFYRAAGHYERGELTQALQEFEAALRHNAQYAEAAVWAGRTALELGEPRRAVVHWEKAVALDPADGRSQYFLALANDQLEWGREAASEFHRGQSLYENGEPAAAHDAFVAAAGSNESYLLAWSWAARTAQELDRLPEAISYWQEVLDRDPADEGARYFKRVAEQRLAFGEGASEDFLQAVALYQQGSFAEAEEGFLATVQANPRFAPGWGHLGQLYFSQGRFEEAADAYEKAAEIDPEHENYSFFATESRRLASAR
jgi:tetratricopeptide (TPR) repeat protein